MFLIDDQVSFGSSVYWLSECLSDSISGISNSQFCSVCEAWEALSYQDSCSLQMAQNNGKIRFSKDIRRYFYFVETLCTGKKGKKKKKLNTNNANSGNLNAITTRFTTFVPLQEQPKFMFFFKDCCSSRYLKRQRKIHKKYWRQYTQNSFWYHQKLVSTILPWTKQQATHLVTSSSSGFSCAKRCLK